MIAHHPHESTLTEFAAGTLDEGRGLVVATHVAMCPVCRRFLSALARVGGHMLEQVPPMAMSESARAQTFSRLDTIDADTRLERAQDALSRYSVGPWRWVGPGIHRRLVNVPCDNGTRVFFLKAAPGMTMPGHRHVGTELTLVLNGAFVHQGGRFAAGDFDDADDSAEHDPVIDPGEDCVCLVAMQGHLRLNSLLGRLVEPFVRL
jgi:putative transcriptional regulator